MNVNAPAEKSSSPQRVIYVTMEFPRSSEAFLSVELKAVCALGIEAEVACLRRRPVGHSRLAAQQGVESIPVDYSSITSVARGAWYAVLHPLLVFRLWSRLIRGWWRRPLVTLVYLFWSLRCFDLVRRLERNPVDIVQVYWGHAPAMLAWLLLERLPEQVVFMSLSGYDTQLALPISFDSALRCHGLRTLGEVTRDEVSSKGIPSERIFVSRRGVELRAFYPRKKVPGLLVAAGRLMAEKGIREAIEIAEALIKKFPDTKLKIFGDGPKRAEFERVVQERDLANSICFLGHVSHEVLGEALGEAEYFLMHSVYKNERLPNVLKEAAAAGCVCLTTATPGVEEILVDQESGFIMPAGELGKWVELIAELRQDAERRELISRAAIERMSSRFDADKLATELVEWWRFASRKAKRE